MARTILILIAAISVSACASLRSHLAFWGHGESRPALASAATTRAPRVHQGLWAILDPGCRKPLGADLSAWPRCASPFWIGQGFALVVQAKPVDEGARAERSYRADYRLAAGDPLIAEIGDDKHGQLFLALTDLDRDGEGQLVGATGAAFACPSGLSGPISLSPNEGGCASAGPNRIRKAAEDSLRDPVALTRVAWIASGAPEL